MQHLWNWAPVAGRHVLDLLLPPHCPACAEPVAAPGQLCAPCFTRTSFITEPLCQRCGLPFPHDGTGGAAQLCLRCQTHPPDFDRARAALMYDEQARRLVLPLKHGDRVELADQLAPLLLRAGAVLLAQAELLVPVPLHVSRLRARGYNQAALLARAVARRRGLPCVVDALRRVRATRALGALGAALRAAELDGAIAVHPRRAAMLAGRRVVLVDDVVTSGATASACARALKAAGVRGVDVLALARVADPRQDGLQLAPEALSPEG